MVGATETLLCTLPLSEQSAALTTTGDGEISLQAQQLYSKDGKQLDLIGDATIDKNGQRLQAGKISYDSESKTLTAQDGIRYNTPDIDLNTPHIEANLQKNSFSTGRSDYRIPLNHKGGSDKQPQRGYGSASSISSHEDGVLVLDEASYSTCSPEQRGWHLSIDKLTLNSNQEQGIAEGTILRIGGVPVMYLPWFSFPIGDTRKSGFLAPRVGSSDQRGFELGIPWYWNIAPQADATLMPNLMSDRGLALNSQWRYLNGLGHWQLDSEYLQKDRQTKRRRHLTQLTHRGQFGQGWSTHIDASVVSDRDYFADFSQSLDAINTTYLESRFSLNYQSYSQLVAQTFRMRVQDFEPIDTVITVDNQLYNRAPQINYTAQLKTPATNFTVDLNTEYIHFKRSQSVQSERLNIQPQISWPLAYAAGFFRPSVGVWLTRYQLDYRQAIDTQNDNDAATINRYAPVYSIDSGLYFDRLTDSGTQTLEPRLFYLYIPYRDQADIPLFDTSLFELSFDQLFRDNRFTGIDRIGDTRQLTAALSSRFIDLAGREWLHAGIGQIYYLANRRVQLPDQGAQTDSRSNLIMFAKGRLAKHWTVGTTVEWHNSERQVERSTTHLGYHTPRGNFIRINHYLNREQYDQLNLSLSQAITPQWRLKAAWGYNLTEEHTADATLGVNYDSCCWAASIATRRYRNNDTGEDVDTLYFQFVMKGLGSAGNGIDGLF